MYVTGQEQVPGRNEALHKDNPLIVFQWFHQFGMQFRLLHIQPKKYTRKKGNNYYPKA